MTTPKIATLDEIQSITEKVNNETANTLFLIANVQVDDAFIDGAYDYVELDKYMTYPGAEDVVEFDHIMFEVLGDYAEPVAEITTNGSVDVLENDDDYQLETANLADAIKKEFKNL